MAKGKLFIGTSGYSYDHWKGVFYPTDIPSSKWLEHYIKHFSTVELNNTFYRLPKPEAFKSWGKRVPAKFIYAVKASRFITHIKRLNDCRQPLKLFLSRAKFLGKKLGPILYQLPPKWKCNVERLESFVKLLPKGGIYVFEFRDPSWFNDEVYSILKKNKLSFCVYSMPGGECPHVVTSKVVYIRMHGGSVLYGSNYSEKELKDIASKIRVHLKNGLDVYIYFNNDARGYAVRNAKKLKRLLKA